MAVITWISLCSISLMRLRSQLNDVLHCDEISAETQCKNEYMFEPDRLKKSKAPDVIFEPVQVIEAPLQHATASATKSDALGEFSNCSTPTLPKTISEEVIVKNISSKIPLEMKTTVPLRDPERFRNTEIMSTHIFSWTALLAVSNLTMVAYQVYEYYNCSQNAVKPLAIDATEEIKALKRHNQALQVELHKLASNNFILNENLQLITNHNRILLQRIKKYKKIGKASSIQQNENIKRTLFYLEQVYAMLNSQFNQKRAMSPATILPSNRSVRTIVQMSRRIQSVRSAAILRRICAELLAPIRSRYNEVYTANVLLRDQMRRIHASRGKSATALGALKPGETKDPLKKTATSISVRNAKSTISCSIKNDNLRAQTNRRVNFSRNQIENAQTERNTADLVDDKVFSPININV